MNTLTTSNLLPETNYDVIDLGKTSIRYRVHVYKNETKTYD